MSGVTFDFAGAHVLVTGGTSRHRPRDRERVLGRRCRCDDHGHQGGRDRLRRDLARFGYAQCRMTEPADIEAVAAGLDRLDVLVNNAGQNLPGGRSEYEPDVFEETVSINLFGAYRMADATRTLLAAERARRRWERREPGVHVVVLRHRDGARLRRGEGGNRAAHEDARGRVGKALHPGERRRPGHRRDADDRTDDADRAADCAACSRARRWGVSRRPTRSRPRCCSSRARRPDTSPARPSPSTAVSRSPVDASPPGGHFQGMIDIIIASGSSTSSTKRPSSLQVSR